jgi:hypothetical protein
MGSGGPALVCALLSSVKWGFAKGICRVTQQQRQMWPPCPFVQRPQDRWRHVVGCKRGHDVASYHTKEFAELC